MEFSVNRPNDELLTAVEVARILKVTESFVYELIKRGEIGSVHLGRAVRVRPSDLDKFINDHSQDGRVYR